MSKDFLSGFSQENYQKQPSKEVRSEGVDVTEEQDQPPIASSEPGAEKVQQEKGEVTPKALTTMDLPIKEIHPEASQATTDSDVTTVDTTYQQRQRKKYFIIGLVVIAVITLLATTFYLTNRVTMRNLVGVEIGEAKTWALKNKIELESEVVFSTVVDEGFIIEQSVAEGRKISQRSNVKITVSKGADPDEVLTLPDFANMKQSAIDQWIKEQRATNLKVVLEFSETVPKGDFIGLKFTSPDVQETSYRRKDAGVITVSKGVEVFEANIEVPDFRNKPREDVERWAEEHLITVAYTESDSDTVAERSVISQSIAPKEKVAKKSDFAVVISLGQAAVVPSFRAMTLQQASSYNVGDGLLVMTNQAYSSSVPFGQRVSQSVAADTRLTGNDKRVEVTYSLGRPFVADLSGRSESELAEYFFQFQSQGAQITYTVHYRRVEGLQIGQVIENDKANEFVSMNQHVDVYVHR